MEAAERAGCVEAAERAGWVEAAERAGWVEEAERAGWVEEAERAGCVEEAAGCCKGGGCGEVGCGAGGSGAGGGGEGDNCGGDVAGGAAFFLLLVRRAARYTLSARASETHIVISIEKDIFFLGVFCAAHANIFDTANCLKSRCRDLAQKKNTLPIFFF